MAEIETFVNEKIKSKKVVVFSKHYCPFCQKALNSLAKYNLKPEDYEVVELVDNPDMGAIQDYLLKLTGGRSVPRVFIGGEFIGGGDETAAMAANGQLQQKLKDVGAL